MMDSSNVVAALVPRLTALGSIDSASLPDRVLSTIRQWLSEVVDLPAKSVVIDATSRALDQVFAGVDSPGPDMITEPALKALILGLVDWAYEQIARDTV